MTLAAIMPAPFAPKSKPDKDWMSRKEAANYLTRLGCRISAKTLANMASNNNAGKGPSYTRIRWGLVQYKRDDLDEWAQKEMVKVT